MVDYEPRFGDQEKISCKTQGFGGIGWKISRMQYDFGMEFHDLKIKSSLKLNDDPKQTLRYLLPIRKYPDT